LARVIQLRELQKPSEDGGFSAYELRLDDELLGFLHLDPGSYAVVWKGTFDFHKVGEAAFDFLSLQTKAERRRWFGRSSRPDAKAFVSFILTGKDPELVEFNLDDPIQQEAYDKTLRDSDRISFARFDFEAHLSQMVLNCTFTAENTDSTGCHGSELAIQLPRPLPLSEESFKWILDRHVSAESLAGNVDLGACVAMLSHVVTKPPFVDSAASAQVSKAVVS
jgi:hypothetical protein